MGGLTKKNPAKENGLAPEHRPISCKMPAPDEAICKQNLIGNDALKDETNIPASAACETPFLEAASNDLTRLHPTPDGQVGTWPFAAQDSVVHKDGSITPNGQGEALKPDHDELGALDARGQELKEKGLQGPVPEGPYTSGPGERSFLEKINYPYGRYEDFPEEKKRENEKFWEAVNRHDKIVEDGKSTKSLGGAPVMTAHGVLGNHVCGENETPEACQDRIENVVMRDVRMGDATGQLAENAVGLGVDAVNRDPNAKGRDLEKQWIHQLKTEGHSQ
jgi:hypothetical protein